MIPFRSPVSVALILFTLAVVDATAQPGERRGDPAGGAALSRDLRAMQPAEDFEWRGVMKIRDANRNTREIPVTCVTTVKDDHWTVSYEAKDITGAVTERLVVHRFVDRPIRYVYWRKDADREVELSGAKADIPFAGSDFWLSDLGLEFLQWPLQYQLAGEMRRGQPCYVLDSYSPRIQPGHYFRLRSWIEKEHGGLLQAEAYDQDGRMMKEFSPGSFIKDANGRWQIKDVEIRSIRERTRTRLEFEIER